MRYDARRELWQPAVVKGVHGYVNDDRIDRATLPEGINLYELADEDSNGWPCRYANGIMVNFYATFITTGTLPSEIEDGVHGFIRSHKEYQLKSVDPISFAEVLKEIQKEGGVSNA